MMQQERTIGAAPRHAFLFRGKDGDAVRLDAAAIRELVSPLAVQGDPGDAQGMRIEGSDVVATVRQIRQGMVVTLSPELEWEEFSQLADRYLGKLGAAVGRELEVVEL